MFPNVFECRKIPSNVFLCLKMSKNVFICPKKTENVPLLVLQNPTMTIKCPLMSKYTLDVFRCSLTSFKCHKICINCLHVFPNALKNPSILPLNLILALIDGTCDVPVELRESCEQKIGGGEITSVSRCASAECCFETGSFSQRVECFKERAAITDESLVLNWDADRVYVSYLYNHWVKTVQLFTAEANSTGPPLFPGVKHMSF